MRCPGVRPLRWYPPLAVYRFGRVGLVLLPAGWTPEPRRIDLWSAEAEAEAAEVEVEEAREVGPPRQEAVTKTGPLADAARTIVNRRSG